MISRSEASKLKPEPESVEETDVVVVGGGTAGFTAAYAAARTGAKTVLIENASFLGGTTTGGLVDSMTGWRVTRYPDQGEQYTQLSTEQTVGGFPVEFIGRLKAAGGAWLPDDKVTTMIAIDPESVKIVMEEMLEEAGVDIWYLTQFIDAVVEEGRVIGVVVASEAALHLIWCKAAVDASGDGDLAVRAGADFQFGRPNDGKPQPVTLAYMLGGVDFERFVEYLKENPEEVVRPEKRIDFRQTITAEMVEEYYRKGWPIFIQGLGKAASQAAANGEFPVPMGSASHSAFSGVSQAMKGGKVVWSVSEYCGQDMGFGVDSTNHRQMRTALIAGRKFALSLARFYKKYVPGFEDSYLIQTASMLGVRESRRIVGDYMLTEEDTRQCREFDDAVGRSGCRIDIHAPDLQSRGAASDIGPKGWYHIPYRVLLPKGIEGLLVAGRCASNAHVAHASMRHQAICMVTGHAAGTAAALAVQQDTTPRRLEVEGLQATLRNQGAII